MYLLRNYFKYFLIILFFIISCKAAGPLTPEDAYNSLKKAYVKGDAGKIESLLSERSKEKIKSMTGIISSMKESQLEALARNFDTDTEKLKNLSVKDYLELQLSLGERIGEGTLMEIMKQKIAGIDSGKDTAVVRIENGMELSFVKEGAYWKFDMEELSAED